MDLTFISRRAWGAQYAAGFGARPIPCAEAWLHHTVTLAPDLAFTDLNADSVDDDEAKAMRTIERIGQQRFGGGFSYNLAVMPSGRLYVGCGVRRIGAHTAKRNTRALGVVMVGDYSKTAPPAPMQDALVQLLLFAKQERWLNTPAFTGGHRNAPGARTACPGDAAYRLLPSINARAAGKQPAPAPVPPPTPAPAPAPLTVGGPTMLVVQAPDDARQYLCDKDTARHISPREKAVLNAAGVPYVGEAHADDEARREFLTVRGVQL